MCGFYQCECGAESMLTVNISYCHKERAWRLHHCAQSVTDDGVVIEHGSSNLMFGPFDDWRDVLVYLEHNLGQVLPIMASRDNLVP